MAKKEQTTQKEPETSTADMTSPALEEEEVKVPSEPSPEGETLLAGKFKTPEELEKSYKELESKLGAGPEEIETWRQKAETFDALAPYLESSEGEAEEAPEEEEEEEKPKKPSPAPFRISPEGRAAMIAEQRIQLFKQEMDFEKTFGELAKDKAFRNAVAGQLNAARLEGKIITLVDAGKEIVKLMERAKEEGKKEQAEALTPAEQAFVESSRSAPAPSKVAESYEKGMKTGDFADYLKETIVKKSFGEK